MTEGSQLTMQRYVLSPDPSGESISIATSASSAIPTADPLTAPTHCAVNATSGISVKSQGN